MIDIFWNCHEIGHPATTRYLRGLITSHRPTVVFLSKVKCTIVTTADHLVKSLCFASFEFVPARGRVGGLLLMWCASINIKIILANENMINCLIFDELNDNPWQFSTVYGPPFLLFVTYFGINFTLLVLHFLDLGCLPEILIPFLSQVDKKDGRPVGDTSNGGFWRFINDHGLIDIGFQGHPYTWTKGEGFLLIFKNDLIGILLMNLGGSCSLTLL